MGTTRALPSRAPTTGGARRRERALSGWALVLATLAARSYLAFVATLVAAAFVPSVVHWESFVVPSGSMTPSISVGDVVVARPMDSSEPVDVGRVFVFEDQESPGRLLVHRVVERSRDGGWVTKGDANADQDATPAPRDAFRARARILVPFVGLPVLWWRERQLGKLLAWLLLTTAALSVLLVRRPRDDGGPRGRRGRAVRSASVVAVAAALVVAPGVETASGAFTAHTRNPGNAWTAGPATLQRYNQAVLQDGPSAYYLVDEASGGSAQDYTGNGRTGLYTSLAGYGAAGALPNNFGYAVSLGSTGRLVSGGAATVDPRTFSLELWFRTTTRAGGRLVGFENTQTSLSSLYDRYVTMAADGRLVYGDWAGSAYRTVVSPGSYNDGAWHHLVLTSIPNGQAEYAVMYVDGAAVVAGAVTRTSSYGGWWRVGYGRTAYGSLGFAGTVDQVAVYGSALTAARVQAHYAAR